MHMQLWRVRLRLGCWQRCTWPQLCCGCCQVCRRTASSCNTPIHDALRYLCREVTRCEVVYAYSVAHPTLRNALHWDNVPPRCPSVVRACTHTITKYNCYCLNPPLAGFQWTAASGSSGSNRGPAWKQSWRLRRPASPKRRIKTSGYGMLVARVDTCTL